MVRIDDLPEMTSTVCCGRTYIARNKINYPQMLPDMVNETLTAFYENLLLHLYTQQKKFCTDGVSGKSCLGQE